MTSSPTGHLSSNQHSLEFSGIIIKKEHISWYLHFVSFDKLRAIRYHELNRTKICFTWFKARASRIYHGAVYLFCIRLLDSGSLKYWQYFSHFQYNSSSVSKIFFPRNTKMTFIQFKSKFIFVLVWCLFFFCFIFC